MKTNQSIYSALFIGCLLAAAPSCSTEDDNLPKEKTPVGITATLTGEVETKADVDYTPAADTKIYMYYKNGANTTATENAIYTYNSSESKWNTADQLQEADKCIFWDDLGKVDNKYPFFAISPTDVGATSTEVQENQSTDANLAKSDLLMAYTPNTAFKGKVNLVFKHMLSKLTIKVDLTAVANADKVTVAAVINKAVKDYTVDYTSPAPTANTPAKVTTSTTRVTITPKTVTGTGNTTREFTAVLPAQDIQSGLATITITVTQPGSGTATNYTYTYQPEAIKKVTLEQSKETTLTLTIKGTVVELGSITVTNWTQKTATGDITIDNP